MMRSTLGKSVSQRGQARRSGLRPATKTILAPEWPKDVGDAFRRFAKIDGHDDGAQAGDGEIGDVPFGAIGREDGHAVAFANAHFGERLRKTRNAAKHLLARECSPSGRRLCESVRSASR